MRIFMGLLMLGRCILLDIQVSLCILLFLPLKKKKETHTGHELLRQKTGDGLGQKVEHHI